ncbi:MAG: YfiR family protein [Desulforhopalus sp.]
MITAVMLLLFFAWPPAAAIADIRGASAKDIEAAFLVQFGKYVTWPDSVFLSHDAPIIIGIFGRDPFGSVLDKIALQAKVNDRSVEIRRFDDLDSIKDSHILFVASSEAKHMEEIMDALGCAPVLLVGDSENFLRFGIINFVKVDKKIRFNISRKNCQKAGLKLSSKLLQVAHKVICLKKS